MRENKPPGLGLNRRSAVADLDDFPGKFGLHEELGLVPEKNVVGPQEEQIFVVEPTEHQETVVDLPREKQTFRF